MDWFWTKKKRKQAFDAFLKDLKDKSVPDDLLIERFDSGCFNVDEIGGLLMFYPPDEIRSMKLAEHIIESRINPSNIEEYYAAFLSYWHDEHDGIVCPYEKGRHWGNDAVILEKLQAIKKVHQAKQTCSPAKKEKK